MVARLRAIAVVGVGPAILLTITAAPAAPQANNPYNLREPRKDAPMTICAREAGIYFDAYKNKWVMNSGAGNPQEQAYYNCLDRIANPRMKQRDASKPRSASPILTRRRHAVPKPSSAQNIRAIHKRVAQKLEAAPSASKSLPSVAAPVQLEAAPVQQPAQPAVAGSQPDSSPQHKTPLTPQQLQEGLQKHRWTRFVPSEANQRIGFYYALNPDCTSQGTVNIRITKQPQHGAVNIAAATLFPSYSKENLRYKCNQHKVKGMEIHYKSAGKYTGNDALELLVLFPNGFAWEVQYDVSVR